MSPEAIDAIIGSFAVLGAVTLSVLGASILYGLFDEARGWWRRRSLNKLPDMGAIRRRLAELEIRMVRLEGDKSDAD